MMSDSQKLLDVVETIRAELHPDLNAEFLAAVIEAEQRHPDNDEGALKDLQALVDSLLRERV